MIMAMTIDVTRGVLLLMIASLGLVPNYKPIYGRFIRFLKILPWICNSDGRAKERAYARR